jgi:O-antigen/teichoic acid export membrane protein
LSNSKNAVKAGAGYTIGNIFLKALNFLTLPIFSLILSESDYGIYSTFAAYESIFFILIGLAIHSSYKNAKYRYDETTYHQYVSTTMVFLIISGILWLVVGNVFYPLLGSLLDLDRLSINLLIIFSFSTAVLTCFNADVALEYKYQAYLKISVLNAVSNIILSVLLILTFFTGQRYTGRIVGTTIPVFLIAIYIIIRFMKRAKPIRGQNSHMKWGLRYSLPIVPHGLSQVVLSQFDRIMIKRMIGNAEAGIYSFAYNIYMIVNVIANSLDNVWCPWFYEQMNGGNKKKIKEVGSLYMILMLAFSVAVILVCPEMIFVLGAGKYKAAAYCAVPIIASGYFAFLYTLPAAVEYFHEKTNFIAMGTAGAALMNIMLNAIFIPKFGYVAAAYTTLATYLLYFGVHYLLARMIQKEFLFSNRTVILCVVGILVATLVTNMLMEQMLIRWIITLVLGVITVIYADRKFHIREWIKRRRKN